MVDTSSVNQYSTTELMRQIHDDVIKWKHFSRYWPFVRGIHRSPVNSAHKGQWREALVFSLICAWINGWVNNGEAGDLRHHRTHYDVIVMSYEIFCYHFIRFCLKSDTNDISKKLLLIKFDFLQNLWNPYELIELISNIIFTVHQCQHLRVKNVGKYLATHEEALVCLVNRKHTRASSRLLLVLHQISTLHFSFSDPHWLHSTHGERPQGRLWCIWSGRGGGRRRRRLRAK